jgi:hypothetical protein
MTERDVRDTVKFWRSILTSTYAGPNFVYFIQEDGGAVKIGQAHDPLGRAAELQCGNPRPLTVRCALLATWETERHLHDHWRYASIRGEWFGKGHETEILAAADRICEAQIRAHIKGAPAQDITGGVIVKALFARVGVELVC